MSPVLIAFEEARKRVLGHTVPLAPQTVGLDEALHRVLSEDIRSPVDVPAFDNSVMDGFAVRARDTAPGARLRIVGESRAGTPARAEVGPGEACAISTGAMVPSGADAVVRVEDTVTHEGELELEYTLDPGHNLRHIGDDIRAGERVLAAGTRIGPTELGVLASIGQTVVSVGARPRVAIVTTGDELVGVADPLPPGAVRNSAAYTIPALVELAGGSVASVTHAHDDPQRILDCVGAALDSDVVVITGGMSVGRHDHIADVLARLGVSSHFAGVAFRPGKPTSFGTHGATLVFGLPGNPVSSLMTFLLFARPALLTLAGEDPTRVRAVASLARDCAQTPGRSLALRCRLELRDDGWWALDTGAQDSHILTSMLGADAIAIVPAGEGVLAAGTAVTVERLAGLSG